jgi:hypothetical protein
MRKASDANLDFDGMTGDGVNRDGNKYAGNHWGGVQNPNKTINEGRGPTRGNQDHAAMRVGPPATKDAFRRAPHTSEASGREYPKNIDSISYGKQERNPSGTRPWTPEKGQNYKGNPDMIRIGQTGGPGYGEVSRSSNPERSSSKADSFNYGPKKQY